MYIQIFKQLIKPGPPLGLAITHSTNKVIGIRWSPPEHTEFVKRYEVQMKHKALDEWEHVCFTSRSRLFAEVAGLKSNTKYYFRVYSWDEYGKANFSDFIRGKTKLPAIISHEPNRKSAKSLHKEHRQKL
jgi:hypothetical protein